jgi:hypothetical protein
MREKVEEVLVLRHRKMGLQQADEFRLRKDYTLDEVNGIINNAIEKKVELVLFPHQGDAIRIDTEFAAHLSVAVADVKRLR